MKRTALSDNDFNLLEKYASKVFQHSDDWFYSKYYGRRTVEAGDLSDLRDAFAADGRIDICKIAAEIENRKIAEIIGAKQ